MATYSQWRAAADRGEVRRATFVYGSEAVLVDEVVTTVTALVGPAAIDHVSLSCVDTPAPEVWAQARMYPVTPAAPRLVVARDAHALTSWAPLQPWLDTCRTLPKVYLLFVSAQPDLPDPTPAHVAVLTARRHGQVVKCSTPNTEDLLVWLRRRLPIDQAMAYRLLSNVGGDVSAAADAAGKLAVFDGAPGPASVDAVCATPTGEFVTALLTGDKPAAIAAAHTATLGTLTTLAARVDLLGDLWHAVRAGRSAREIRGHPPFLVHRYLPLARHYDPRRCAYARRVLAVVEDAYRSGARIGVIEALVALW